MVGTGGWVPAAAHPPGMLPVEPRRVAGARWPRYVPGKGCPRETRLGARRLPVPSGWVARPRPGVAYLCLPTGLPGPSCGLEPAV